MAPDSERLTRRLTFLLMAVAYAACEVAAYPDGIPRPFGVGYGLFLFAVAIGASYLVPSPSADGRMPLKLTAMLAAVLILPLAAEPLMRRLTDSGLPLELQLVNGLRNLGLALAALAAWPKTRRLAAVVALFLALFASAMGDQRAIPYLLGTFAVVGGLWLIADHSARMTSATAADVIVGAEVRRVRLRWPLREGLVFGLLIAATVAVAVAGPKQVSVVLGEWMPTSGGTGDFDPFSRGGVNDGPEETAGENPETAGMVETGMMIESDQDALIDVAGERFGPPHKPPKERQRMVAGGFERVKQSHHTPENKRPSRDFDTARAAPQQARRSAGRDARSLFEVEGRTPLHIRAVVYDQYNAEDARWIEGAKPNSHLLAAEEADSEWMTPLAIRRPRDWYAADDAHRLKAADMKDNLVPTPTMLTRFRVKRVARPDYFEFDYEGVIAFNGRRRTPSGVIVHTECRTLDPIRLPADAFPTGAGGFAREHLEVPPELRDEIERLARQWTADVPPGYPRMEAILTRLREDYVADRSATAPRGHPAPVLWFLKESHRGGDYLFATSAALMLRTLGYPTRVCLGYYAAPEAFDPESDHTPVTARDLHVWPEVLLNDGHWLVIEPTPGYAVLPPLKPWREWAAERLTAVLAWIKRHAGELIAGVIALSLAIWRRKRLADAAHSLAWRLVPGRTWDRTVFRTLRLLERRAKWAGRPRTECETLTGWATRLNADDRLHTLVELAEWAAYAQRPPCPSDAVADACRAAVASWPLCRFTALNADSNGVAV